MTIDVEENSTEVFMTWQTTCGLCISTSLINEWVHKINETRHHLYLLGHEMTEDKIDAQIESIFWDWFNSEYDETLEQFGIDDEVVEKVVAIVKKHLGYVQLEMEF